MKQNAFDNLLECIGGTLHSIRHQRNEKIEIVAKGIGVSHSVVSKIENGRYKGLSIRLLHSFADYYSVNIDEIIKAWYSYMEQIVSTGNNLSFLFLFIIIFLS